ncbi:MAG: response regulator transcription factor [Opitutales bacterium]
MTDTPSTSDKRDLILTVEDDVNIRTFIKLGLQDSYKIIEAENGQDGIEKALTYGPQLILTDVMMPRIDGISMCRTLRRDPSTTHIPIIILTVLNSDSSQLEGFQAGADDYINKPFSLPILKTRIQNMLRLHRARNDQESTAEGADDEAPLPAYFENDTLEQKVARTIQLNYWRPEFDTAYLANQLGLTLRSLQRNLKKHGPKTPAELILDHRMDRAIAMLKDSKTNVSEVAALVGMDDPSRFSRVFKKRFGQTPKKYQQDHTRPEQ